MKKAEESSPEENTILKPEAYEPLVLPTTGALTKSINSVSPEEQREDVKHNPQRADGKGDSSATSHLFNCEDSRETLAKVENSECV